MTIEPWLLDLLVCPFCKNSLTLDHDRLSCLHCGRIYPVRDGIPVMLIDEAEVIPEIVQHRLPSTSQQPRSNVQNRTSQFTATYYPWSIITNQNTLKRALLYFDKIQLLAPKELDHILEEFLRVDRREGFQSPNFTTEMRRNVLEFYAQVKPLRDSGVIEIVDANEHFNSEVARTAVTQMAVDDIFDPERQHIDVSASTSAIDPGTIMGLSRSPEGDIAFQFWKAGGIYEVFTRVSAQAGEMLESLDPLLRSFFGRTISLNSSAATSVLLNASLLCVNASNSTPLVDTPAYFRDLQRRYRRIFRRPENGENRRNYEVLEELVARAPSSSGYLAEMALSIMLPNLEYKNYEDVLELRFRFDDHLQQFRLKMLSLSDAMRSSVVDREFYHECQQVINREIIPELLELQKQLRMSRLKVLRNMSKSLLSLKPTVPFILSALTPVPLYAAAMVAAGLITLEAAAELYLERGNILYNNGLVYLLDVAEGSVQLNSDFWARSTALSHVYKV